MCQCPLGLIPHFYPEDDESDDAELDTCVNALSGLYLISTTLMDAFFTMELSSVNALSGL